MPEADKSIEEGKIFAFIGYWGILFLVPLLGKRDNKFALFHGKQGMVSCIAMVIILIVMHIFLIIPYLGPILYVIFWLAICVIGVLDIIGMIKSLTGDYWKMPIFGDIAEKLKI